MCVVGKSRFRAGFTLLELLMVVVIIGILFGILMPVISGMNKRALDKQRDAEARLLESAIRNYHAENGVWPGVTPPRTYSDDNATLINAINNGPNNLVLLDTHNMVLQNGYYRKPGTTNSWMITIDTNNTVTVQ